MNDSNANNGGGKPVLKDLIEFVRGDRTDIDREAAVKVLMGNFSSKKKWRDDFRRLRMKIENYVFELRGKGCTAFANALQSMLDEFPRGRGDGHQTGGEDA